ncbi:DUF6521 family protein [Methylocystis sp. MJC1]|uniref:three component ABC system middle component n=1 Tax=Methylocystis sp. MJC1 TaxID=2654282 RepID=UPI0013EE3AB3|nr:three component ABC system middle component [Methylocystis sp. MJC1]MBU6525955.1 hypothetical protein [Methylocystis sp. MJC1]UZX12422.1 DUF6521 family protein [Methylocystis sp. MJC1]
MKRWDQRPIEIRNLFNPAFCGLTLFHALRGYEDDDVRGMPFSLSLLILPLCLQKESREIFARSSRSYLLKIIEANPQLLVGFAQRVTDLLPFTFEAQGLLMHFDCFEVAADGRFKTKAERVRKSITGTDETKACQRTARYLGKEFARISDRMTIYTSFGIRP